MARTTISSLFGSSPVHPLQQHMQSVQTCIRELLPFLEAVVDDNWDEAARKQAEISRLEREADKLKKQLRMNLPNSLFMPIDRRDLLEVLTMQDTIANRAKDIAGLITGRHMVFPHDMGVNIIEFAKRCIDASAQAQSAINELDELVETGFRGSEVDLVKSMLRELDTIESDTDKIQIAVRSQLYVIEKDLPPIDAMFLYKVIDWIGDLADRAQRVGSRLQLMLAR